MADSNTTSLTEDDAGETDADSSGVPNVDLRTTALVLAIERVSRVTLERGIWP